MTFEEILPRIKNGEKFVRLGWGGLEEYIVIKDSKTLDGQKFTPYFVISVKGEGYSMFQPTVCDILATDWVEVK